MFTIRPIPQRHRAERRVDVTRSSSTGSLLPAKLLFTAGTQQYFLYLQQTSPKLPRKRHHPML
jgi:hypothetical protein